MEHLRSGLLVGKRRDFNGFDVHGSYDGESGSAEKQCKPSIEQSDWDRRRRFSVDGICPRLLPSTSLPALDAPELLIGPSLAPSTCSTARYRRRQIVTARVCIEYVHDNLFSVRLYPITWHYIIQS
jgi:hypothetical protein